MCHGVASAAIKRCGELTVRLPTNYQEERRPHGLPLVYGMAQGAGGSVQDPNGKVEIGECVQSQDNAKRCVLEISMAARAGVMFPDWLY